MSNKLDHLNGQAVCEENPCRAVELLIDPRHHNVGGLSVRRVLPVRQRRSVGPWVFFDHMGPASFEHVKGIDVRPHPHINLATVTYLFEGAIHHRDSLGSSQIIRPGAVNLMVSGRGITHSEREPEELLGSRRTLHGIQLWHALPAEIEEMEPEFLHYPSEEIPSLSRGDAEIRVVMGTAFGETSPVRTFAETLCVTASLPSGTSFPIPEATERAVYVVEGGFRVDGVEVPETHLAVIRASSPVSVEAVGDTRLMVVGGEPLGERFMDWNFISSRRERLDQAREDWKNGRFPVVPGDSEEFIPYPETRRPSR